ncbi:50S ribosomal protein L31 [Kitasatospora aureofaciens]|uniref:50S ribosomal protein L31 n=1 Tax=Kitasatospora aureofaciens TaxID=1894 RepID=UPI003401B903
MHVKVAFVGKGGSGKTTLSALFVRHLAASARTVVAIDADINQHLAAALGMSEDQAFLPPALGEHLPEIKEYLRGSNPLISSASHPFYTGKSRVVDIAGRAERFNRRYGTTRS